MKNFATIYEWQAVENSPDETNLSLGINFTVLDGHLQMILLDQLIEVLECFAVAENRENSIIIDLVYEWIGYAQHFKLLDVSRLKANILFSLVKKMAAVGLLLIRFLPGAIGKN
jgi:hypothetical protein